MGGGGYIKLYRKFVDCSWYRNANAKALFVHLLLTAEYKDGYINGVWVQRGQVLTTLPELSQQTGLTAQNLRTALKFLKNEKNITECLTGKQRLITVVNYEDYQGGAREANSKPNRNLTGCQQDANRIPNRNTIYKENNIRNKEYKELFFSAETRTKTKNVIDELNRLTGKHFSANAEGTLKLVDKLIKDGYTEADMLAVVTKACECWAGTEYAKYLNPTNLLGQRFDGFLNGGIFRPAVQKQTAAHSYDARGSVDYSGVFTRLDELEEAET